MTHEMLRLNCVRMRYVNYNEYHYNCADSAVSIDATPMCDIMQVGYWVETYTYQTFANSQLNTGKALSYSTPICKSTGKTDYQPRPQVPPPRTKKGPGTHCVRMLYFSIKHWEFGYHCILARIIIPYPVRNKHDDTVNATFDRAE